MVLCRTCHTAPDQGQGLTPIVPHCSGSGPCPSPGDRPVWIHHYSRGRTCVTRAQCAQPLRRNAWLLAFGYIEQRPCITVISVYVADSGSSYLSCSDSPVLQWCLFMLQVRVARTLGVRIRRSPRPRQPPPPPPSTGTTTNHGRPSRRTTQRHVTASKVRTITACVCVCLCVCVCVKGTL